MRLQPRSSRSLVEGVQGSALKVRVAAPPIEGEANKALLELLSKLTGVRKSALSITSGHRSRDKTVYAEGVSPESLEEIFSDYSKKQPYPPKVLRRTSDKKS